VTEREWGVRRTGCADAAIARGQVEQDIDGEFGVLIVGGHFLGDLPFVAGVGAWAVVG
jgi:hypothetical protein